MNRIELSVVIPVYNEQSNLGSLIDRCMNVLWNSAVTFELILVDDGSGDRSAEMISDAAEHYDEVVGVLLNRNYGQHAAIMAGFEHCRGEIVVTLDADLQNPPEEIPRLVEMINKGHDVVGSVRRNRKDSFFRRLASSAVNWVIRRSTGIGMRDYGCMLRAYRRDIIDAILACREKTTFIPVLANSFASSPAEVEVKHDSRSDGESKYNLFRLITLQFDLTTSMTTFPIRMLTFIGIAMAGLGLSLSLLILVLRLVYGPTWAVGGVFTLMAIVLAFMGIQLLSLGLIGEYIGRVFVQVRDRPAFWVKQVVGLNVRKQIKKIGEVI